MAKESIPKGYSKGQLNNFNPDMMNLFKSLFGNLGPDSFLGKIAGGDQSQFEALEEPAMRQLGEFQGQLASRFSGMGLGGRHGSGHALAQGQLAKDFAGDLKSQRMGLQWQAIKDLMEMSGSLLQQRPYENFLIPKQRKSSIWESILGGALPVAGGLIGGLVPGGGIPGAKIGASIGGAASRGFFG